MQPRRKRILTFTLVLITISFGVLTLLVYLHPENLIDERFSARIQRHQYPALDIAMKWISFPGYAPRAAVMAAVISLLFLLNRYKKEAGFVLLTLLSGAVSTLVKLLVNRPRPSADIVRIVGTTEQQSFPSGHTQFYVVFFGFLIIVMYTLRTLPSWVRFSAIAIASLFIIAVPFSRIYLGAHWFTDVVGGFLLGLLCLAVLSYFYLRKTGSQV